MGNLKFILKAKITYQIRYLYYKILALHSNMNKFNMDKLLYLQYNSKVKRDRINFKRNKKVFIYIIYIFILFEQSKKGRI